MPRDRIKDAVNTLLLSIGQEMLDDMDDPSALMAKRMLQNAIDELPYTNDDFTYNEIETLNNMSIEVYNLVVAVAGRKFQTNVVSSEVLHEFTVEDEAYNKRAIIRKRLIPKNIQAEVDTELRELYSFSALVPNSLKQNLALIKLEAILFAKVDEYPLSIESVERSYLDFKKRLITKREVPNEVLEATAKELFAIYGFSNVIPVDISKPSNITQTLRTLACYNFQKSILSTDDYVISDAEKNQNELDLRLAIIANRLYPPELYIRVKDEFITTYGYIESEFNSIIEDYILNKTMFRLQSILIPTEAQRPITLEDMDNAEASLITNLISPKIIYERALREIKIELGIEEGVEDKDIPEAVFNYARYKASFLHQPTAIINPRKYVLDEMTLIRAKALAGQSLSPLSFMSSKSVSRILDKDNNPEAVTSSVRAKYRLKVANANSNN
ncbi:hypothetical protein [Campylobacter concisus]|uniref:hypothetical protein n=1 Tax=Campylobacter concisus TaxID=199 RepID=UPI000D3849F1|nr:hypothetical protein [Campylobacter concisus]QPH88698.1 hypothetical protein CVT15_08300 [Campylobacter concisus]